MATKKKKISKSNTVTMTLKELRNKENYWIEKGKGYGRDNLARELRFLLGIDFAIANEIDEHTEYYRHDCY